MTYTTAIERAESPENQYKILDHFLDKTVNIQKNLRVGLYSNLTITIDPLSWDVKTNIFKLKDNVNDVERKCEKVKDDIKNVNKGIQSYVWNGIFLSTQKYYQTLLFLKVRKPSFITLLTILRLLLRRYYEYMCVVNDVVCTFYIYFVKKVAFTVIFTTNLRLCIYYAHILLYFTTKSVVNVVVCIFYICFYDTTAFTTDL